MEREEAMTTAPSTGPARTEHDAVPVSAEELARLREDNSDLRAVLELICDTASTEWQSSDGKRHGATDNEGKRLWFINRAIMKEARAIYANTTTRKVKP